MPGRKPSKSAASRLESETIAARMRERVIAAFGTAAMMPNASTPPDGIARSCAALVAHGAETCRLVALTVMAATAADANVRPDVIQAGAGGHDFRSLYKEAVYPVLLELAARRSAPWQPSRDPFVSNPFREPAIDPGWVQRRNNKLRGALELQSIIQYVAGDPAMAGTILDLLASFELDLLDASAVTYRIPPRLSTAVTIAILTQWLSADTGGRRHEGLGVALLRFAGQNIRTGWDSVESHHVNDPAPYDALCRQDGGVRVVGEIKAQPVVIDHLRQLAVQMDNYRASRGYFFTRSGFLPPETFPEQGAFSAFLRDQHLLGRRIDVLDVLEAARSWLPLLDQSETALPGFVRLLADELDNHGIAADRRALAQLLERL